MKTKQKLKPKWFDLHLSFNRMLARNTFRPLDVERTLNVIKANVCRSATVVTQPIFERLFGPYDLERVGDIKAKSEEVRTKWTEAVTQQKELLLDKDITSKVFNRIDQALNTAGLFVQPLLPFDTFEHLPKDTSSGSPDHITPKSVTFEDCAHYIDMAMQFPTLLPEVQDFWPIMLAFRTQERASGLKIRIIAMFPQVISIMEAMFGLPILWHLKESGQTAYSIGAVWTDLSKVWENLQKYKNIIEIDYTTFDITVKAKMLWLFYGWLESKLNLTGPFYHIFCYMRDYHMHATFISTHNGKIVIGRKTSGVASGSFFTNLADSWINLFIIYYVAELTKIEVDPKTMGDDAIVGTDFGDRYLKVFNEVVQKVFGMGINLEKTFVRTRGEAVFYMGFLINNEFKIMPHELMKRKMMLTTRFIPETVLPNKMVIWSKFCSICSNASNGYDLWLQYKDKLLTELGLQGIDYFHDLEQTAEKPFSVERIIYNAEAYVRDGWRHC